MKATNIPYTNATKEEIAVWFPTVRANSGVDKFTERLAAVLNRRGIRAEITWLPHRAEYMPWSVKVPSAPTWANIIHTHPWLHSRFIPRQLPCVTTLHSCVHDPALKPYKSKAQAFYHQHMLFQREGKNLTRADVVTAVSDHTAGISKQVFECKDISIIYNWIDTDTFLPASNRKCHQPFRLLFVGSLRLMKGADMLPPIMERLGPGYELYFTGALEELARFGNLPDNLKPLGKLSTVNEVVSAYQNCDALLFPTRLEGLPLVALEAMSCGLPVVASDVASLPEVITHEETGVLCRQDDVDGFVSAIQDLKKYPEAREKIAMHGRQRAINHFSEVSAVAKYVGIYRSLINKVTRNCAIH